MAAFQIKVNGHSTPLMSCQIPRCFGSCETIFA